MYYILKGGVKMEEKRKSKRLPLNLELTISKLFAQDSLMIEDLNESIEVENVSKSGIGFYCVHELPIGYYFDANILLPNERHFFSVLKIVRVNKVDNGHSIGCEFVGLADILSKQVDEYESDLELG